MSEYNEHDNQDVNEETEELNTDTQSWSEKVGLPEMNIVHEHSDPAENDIEAIIQAIYIKIGESEAPTNGYSPMDRLVAAVAKLENVDVETALSQGNYPNQLKRIAAIFRGEFDEGTESDDEEGNTNS